MPNLTSITLSASGNVTSSGQFSTLDNSFGTAGTSNANILSVQGVTGGVAQPISGSVTAVIASITGGLGGTSNVALTGTGTVALASGAVVSITGTSAIVSITSSQLSTLFTTTAAMASGYVLSGFPTDQPVPIKVQSITSGASQSRITMTAAGNLATNVKNAAGNIYEIDVYNTGTSAYYVKLINTSTTPTAGTGAILITIPIGPTSGYSKEFRYGMNFSNGIGYYLTGALADTDTSTVPSVITGNIIYV